MWRGGSCLEIEDVPEPRPGPGEVVVDVEPAGICGSGLASPPPLGPLPVLPLTHGRQASERLVTRPGSAVKILLSIADAQAVQSVLRA
jgi:D-arabinose 1-dehydrogenase-like Zn-dependent alcohol dehydrogenase